MHIQEVFNAIYANHIYEYLVINERFKIIEYSDKVFELCVRRDPECQNMKLTDLVPELYGMETEIEKILQGKELLFTLPYIFKEPDQYVHIHIHPGRKNSCISSNGYLYETVIILFENITSMAVAQQSLVQERNEKSLLLDELSSKNIQLKQFNEEMQILVAKEIKKNLEKQKMMELQSRHAQMGEMIGMITHQWKQPLNVIGIITNVLKINLQEKIFSKEKIENKLDDILAQIQHMNHTVSDFQHFFKPSKKKTVFNIFKSIHTVFELIGYEYGLKNIALRAEGDDTLLAYGYANEFNQVLLSLLANAKDAFMDNKHENMYILIKVEKRGDLVCVCVRDNAGGIPDELLDKIFDLYMTTKKEGSGLGLNIAKNMIEHNMNGTLSVANVEDGAEFTILLPSDPSAK